MDIDDDLLALAEGTSSKRSKSSKSKSTKRKRPAQPVPAPDDSASDMDMSSDEDEPLARKARKGGRDSSGEGSDNDDPVDQFPLEGKYIDEADRARILGMSELDREGILGERSEKLNADRQRADLRRMVQEKERAEGGSGPSDAVTRSGGRERKATGATSTKQKTLEKLRRKREEKGKKAERRHDDDSSPRRRHSSHDAYTDDGSEEGEVDTYEEVAAAVAKGSKKGGEAAGPADLKDVMVTRAKLAEFCGAPWFAEWVTGAWVRYLIGEDNERQPVYRLCQVTAVKEEPTRPYRFENVNTDIQLELAHSKSIRYFPMEGVSNSPFSSREFGRLAQTLEAEGDALPLQKEVHKIRDKLAKHTDFILTEADVSSILAKKGNRLNPAQGKAKLLIQRDFAISTSNDELLAEVQAKLAEFDAPAPVPGTETEAERMKKVNERNRASNREEIKRAESRNQDARIKQAAALARGDSGIKLDASARVKTMTRLTYDRDTPSRPSTPQPGTPTSGGATPLAVDQPKAKQSRFEELVAKRVQVDVDLDF